MALKLSEDSSVDIREAAFIDLARQGVALDFDAVKKALADKDDPKGSLLSLRSLMGVQAPPEGDVDAVILAFFENQDVGTVSKAVDWYSLNGPLAYKSLATDHYSAVRGVLRSDLGDEFVRIRHQSIEARRSKFGEYYVEETVKEFSKYEDFIRSQFTEAALSGLVANGEPSDVHFGRQYLGNDRQAICYYNVVTWLDRLLYAPKPLSDFFRRELEREATPKS